MLARLDARDSVLNEAAARAALAELDARFFQLERDRERAEAPLRERRTAHDIAHYRVLRAWIAYDLALGPHPLEWIRA